MITWVKQKNGHVLTIKMDDEAILKTLEEKADKFRKAIKNKDDRNDGEYDELLSCCSEVRGDGDLPPEECLTDIENMIDTLGKLCTESDADVIFNIAQYKKNGTFKRSMKPVIRKLRFGWYDDEAYGWKTHCLRLTPADDFTAEIEYVRITEHY